MNESPRTTPAADDEFYVGYLTKAPPGIARRVRIGVAVMLLAGLSAAVALAGAFRRPAAATWSAQPAAIEGELVCDPYPALRVPGAGGQVQRYLLVVTGKHGAQDRIDSTDSGASARIWGTVLERDGRRIIEIADEPGGGESDVIGGSPLRVAAPVVRPLGRATVTGEIIDPKCFFGAMKPGEGKLHKACAIRCIDGGIPPMLAARNPDGQITYHLLVLAGEQTASSPAGWRPANRRVLPFVGEPVAVTGEATEVDGLRVLKIDDTPEGIVRR